MPLKALIQEHVSQSSKPQRGNLSAALQALQHAAGDQRQIIIDDIAKLIGCDAVALSFLIDAELSDAEIALPEFRDVLLAAE